MLFALATSVLATLALQSPPQAPTQTAPSALVPPESIDVDSFIPPDALLVIRIRSIESLNRLVSGFSDEAERGKPFDIRDMFKEAPPFEANWDSLDRTRPILLGVASADGPSPLRVILAFHAKDAATFATPEALKALELRMSVSGDVVALTFGANPSVSQKKCALLENIDREDIVLRADIAAARAKFGAELDSALDFLETASSGNSSVPGTEEALSTMITRWRKVFASLSRWEIRAGQHGDETKFAFEAVMGADAPLADLGQTDKVDMAELSRGIDAGAPFVYLANMDISSMQKEWLASLDGAMSATHDGFASQMKLFLDAMRETSASVGPAFCASVGFDARGARIAACMRPKNPTQWLGGLVSALGKLPTSLKTSKPETTKVDGADVTEIRLTCDVDALIKSLEPVPIAPVAPGTTPESGDAKPTTPAVRDEPDPKMRAFLEKGMAFALAEKNGVALVAIGDDDHMKSRLARIGGSRSTDALKRAVHSISGMNPCFALQVDMAQLMSNLHLAAETLGDKDAMDTMPVDAWKRVPPILISGGLDDHTWRLELVGDAKRTIAAIKASEKQSKPAADRARADITAMASALDAYAINNSGKYPDTLESLVTPDTNGATYLNTRKMPLDPWGREYGYEPPHPGQPRPRVFTLGKDGKPGGEGDDADFDNLMVAKH